MRSQSQVKSVVFDLGNVVLSWDVEKILASLGLNETEADKLRQYLFSHQVWLDMDEGQIAESRAVEMVRDRSGLSAETIEAALLAAKRSLLPIEESVNLLTELHAAGYPLYCLSNMSVETYDHIKGFDFFRFFSGQVISGIEGCMKPNERIYRILLDRYQLVPSNTLFIDDSVPNVEMAQKLGIQSSLFVNNGTTLSDLRSRLL